jgi:cobalt transporter subunit CbtA
MFRDMLLTAAIAGIIAALAFSVLQWGYVSPLILQAEVYEDAAEAVAHTQDAPVQGATVAPAQEAPAAHHHDESAWKPENGWQRKLFTVAANLLMGIGYAFLLIALYTLWRPPSSAPVGLLFGVAGFIIFFGAPALGLAPELPGTAAAELSSRQLWWAGTAAATAVGLGLIFGQSRWSVRIAGVAVVIAPHLIPAPHLLVERSLAPDELQSHFRWATTACNAVFWLVLGWASSFAFRSILQRRLSASGPLPTA